MDPATSRYLVGVYGSYGAASVALTVFLARTLGRNGAVFLEDVFADKPRLAQAINHLLVVGFYLFNLGYALLWMRAEEPATTLVAAAETLAYKLGLLLLCLGVMHFANLYVFYRVRRRMQLRVLPPPVAPQMRVEPESSVIATLT